MGLIEHIAGCFCAGLARAKGFSAPFSHFRAEKLLPQAVNNAFLSLPLRSLTPASGRRETVANRFYLGDAESLGNAHLKALALALQSPRVAGLLGRLCGVDVNGSYLRIEYAIDSEGFWLEPHTDLGVKKLTGLIALSGGADMGTDLYRSPSHHFGRLPFKRNAGTFFKPGLATWHGFELRTIRGPRKSLIVNYVAPEWQSREQLCFPDRAVTLL